MTRYVHIDRPAIVPHRVQPVVRGVVREHEERVLQRRDQHHRDRRRPPRPERNREADDERERRERLRDGERRAHRVEPRERCEHLRRQLLADVVAELLAGDERRSGRVHRRSRMLR
jgi:hypothetical protein